MTEFGGTESDYSDSDEHGAEDPTQLGPEQPEPGSSDPGYDPAGPTADPEYGDYTGDGIADYVVQLFNDGSMTVVSDENLDQVADTLGYDGNGDGVFELLVVRDGDEYLVRQDLDGDGEYEDETTVTRAELEALNPDVVASLDLQFGVLDPSSATPGEEPLPEPETEEPTSDYVEDGQLVGDPTGDAEHWFQQAVNGFCVPASVAQIVSEYTGEHYEDEMHFVDRANDLKVFTVGPDGVPGVTIEGALALLQDAGVPASIEYGTGVETLVDYLDEGRRVLVAVDSGELWYGETVEDDSMDHAMVVTGVDEERQVVIVSDPGDPDGNQMEYPIELFADAWADSDYTAVVCDEPPTGISGSQDENVVTEDAFETEQVGADTGQPAGLPDPLEFEQSGGDQVVGWLVRHSWVVIPVVLVAARAANSRKSAAS